MTNPMLAYLFDQQGKGATGVAQYDLMAMSWMYFLVTAVIIGAVSAVISKLVYYEN